MKTREIYSHSSEGWASLVSQTVKNLFAMQENRVWYLDWKDPLEEEMTTHFSILARMIPWTEEHGGLQSMGSQRVGQDWEAPSGKPTVYGITYQREYCLFFAFLLTSSLAESAFQVPSSGGYMELYISVLSYFATTTLLLTVHILYCQLFKNKLISNLEF